MYKTFFVAVFWNLLFCAFTIQGYSQLLSEPCVRINAGQDSIQWTAQACTNFGGYVVFVSTNNNPTLSSIDTILDAAQTSYSYPNNTGISRTYQIGIICAGQIAEQTTTFSNQRPITPSIRSVDLYGGVPVLSWEASPTPNVIGYQIYKEEPYGSGIYFPYPSNNQLINGLSFIDSGATNLLVRYQITAETACNKGPRTEGNPLLDGTTGPHSSIFLDYSIDSCDRKLTLNWNTYENWAAGVETYEIWTVINGNPPQLLGTTTENSFIYNNIEDGADFVFWVEAVEANVVNRARTNRIRFNATINQPIDYIHLNKVTVSDDGASVEINWSWDLESDFERAWLQRSMDGQVWADRISFSTQDSNTFVDTEVDVHANRYYYRIVAVDQCGNKSFSNYGSTILLTGEIGENYTNILNWTALDAENTQVVYYDMFKNIRDIENRLTRLDSGIMTHIDRIDVNINAAAKSCYYLSAEVRVIFPDGHQHFFSSRSNTVCLEQKAILWFPNAFVPDGRNTTFKPKLAYGQTLTNYTLQVFDRYGTNVFVTNHWDEGWNGTFNNKSLPQGIYTYAVNYSLTTGEQYKVWGTIMLLR